MAPTLPQFNPARIRSYIFRLPFFTRIVLTFIVLFSILELQSVWDVIRWGALIPAEINLGSSTLQMSHSYLTLERVTHRQERSARTDISAVYRLNTYPVIHSGLLNALLGTCALVPLIERFESEHGSLLTGAMFFGRELYLASSPNS